MQESHDLTFSNGKLKVEWLTPLDQTIKVSLQQETIYIEFDPHK